MSSPIPPYSFLLPYNVQGLEIKFLAITFHDLPSLVAYAGKEIIQHREAGTASVMLNGGGAGGDAASGSGGFLLKTMTKVKLQGCQVQKNLNVFYELKYNIYLKNNQSYIY